jgi:hypothetical protein
VVVTIADEIGKDADIVGKLLGIVTGLPKNIGISLSFTMESVVFKSGTGVTVSLPNALFFNLTTNEIIKLIEEKLHDRIRGQ